jgi:hypothetical protein
MGRGGRVFLALARCFGYVEPDDRNLTPAQAQLNNLVQSSNRMHRPIERVNSCSRWTVYIQLDSHDGVAISIDCASS